MQDFHKMYIAYYTKLAHKINNIITRLYSQTSHFSFLLDFILCAVLADI